MGKVPEGLVRAFRRGSQPIMQLIYGAAPVGIGLEGVEEGGEAKVLHPEAPTAGGAGGLGMAAQPLGTDILSDGVVSADGRPSASMAGAETDGQTSTEADPVGQLCPYARSMPGGNIADTDQNDIVAVPAINSAGGSSEASSGDPAAAGPRAPMRHYWGQAVQYLERSVSVTPGKKLMLMAKRDGPRVRFHLRVRVELSNVPAPRSAPQDRLSPASTAL